jgi:hypothetical protein
MSRLDLWNGLRPVILAGEDPHVGLGLAGFALFVNHLSQILLLGRFLRWVSGPLWGDEWPAVTTPIHYSWSWSSWSWSSWSQLTSSCMGTTIPEPSNLLIWNLLRVKYMGLPDLKRSICNLLMPQEVFEDDEFLQVSSARRLVNIWVTIKYECRSRCLNDCINKPVLM